MNATRHRGSAREAIEAGWLAPDIDRRTSPARPVAMQNHPPFSACVVSIWLATPSARPGTRRPAISVSWLRAPSAFCAFRSAVAPVLS